MAGIGLNNLIVAATNDAVWSPRANSSEVKAIVSKLSDDKNDVAVDPKAIEAMGIFEILLKSDSSN